MKVKEFLRRTGGEESEKPIQTLLSQGGTSLRPLRGSQSLLGLKETSAKSGRGSRSLLWIKETSNVLMHFDGDNASPTMTDEYGNVWTEIKSGRGSRS